MRNEIVFFNRFAYAKLSHEKFSDMGKNLYLLNTGTLPKGKSFIYNITDVINSRASLLEKGQYVYLASLRNYIDVLMSNSRALDVRLIPEVPMDAIGANRLLLLKDGKINFFFEENKNGN